MSQTFKLLKKADPQTMDMLKGFLKPTAIGAGLGGLALGGAEALRSNDVEDPNYPSQDSKTSRILKAMALGGALGGAGGAGAHASGLDTGISNLLGQPQPQTTNPIGTTGALARGISNHPLAAGLVTGGSVLGKQLFNNSAINKANLEGKGLDAFKGTKDFASSNRGLVAATKAYAKRVGGKSFDPTSFAKDTLPDMQAGLRDANNYLNSSKALGNSMTQRLNNSGFSNYLNLIHRIRGAEQGFKFDPKSGFNPRLSSKKRPVSPTNRNLNTAREMLGEGIANSISPVQRLGATAWNNTLGPALTKLDTWRGKNPFTTKDLTPLHADIRNNAISGGWGMHDAAGFTSRRMYIPKNTYMKAVSEGRTNVPLTYGASRYAKGPAAGLAVGGGLSLLNRHFGNADASNLVANDPRITKQLADYILAQREANAQ